MCTPRAWRDGVSPLPGPTQMPSVSGSCKWGKAHCLPLYHNQAFSSKGPLKICSQYSWPIKSSWKESSPQGAGSHHRASWDSSPRWQGTGSLWAECHSLPGFTVCRLCCSSDGLLLASADSVPELPLGVRPPSSSRGLNRMHILLWPPASFAELACQEGQRDTSSSRPQLTEKRLGREKGYFS